MCGTLVSPVNSKAETKQESMFCVTLQQTLQLGTSYNVTANTIQTGVLSLTNDLMKKGCMTSLMSCGLVRRFLRCP